MKGTLFIIATPLGNLEDITLRAVRLLKSVDLILAEDTRVTRRLLDHIGSTVPCESYHKWSEKRLLDRYISLLKEGKRLALVSDAGTPGLSDPGKYLVRAAHEAGISVSPIPGPAAAAAAFSASGALADRFIFGGFLPVKGGERDTAIEELFTACLPVVFYESPERITELLSRLAPFSERITVCRELTKMFEEIFVYTGQQVTEKGEFTLVAEPKQPALQTPETLIEPDIIDIIERSAMSIKEKAILLCRIYPSLKMNAVKSYLLKKGE